jgi:transcriptional regulator with XRE-family HTH domain
MTVRKGERVTSQRKDPAPAPGSDKGPLADLLNALFEHVRRPDGQPYTNAEVAGILQERNPSLRVGSGYLGHLRTGRRTRPSVDVVSALASFFDVDPAAFIDPDKGRRVREELEGARQMSEAGVLGVAMRAASRLSPDKLAELQRFVGELAASQQQPPADRDDAP